MPRVCSSEAAAISAMMSRTWVTERTIRSMVLPVLSTSSVPVFTRLTDSAISPSISLAARALRLASCALRWQPPRSPGLFAGARRFDRGVERRDVGLEGNAVDQGGNFGDTLRTAGDIAHGADHVFHQLAALLRGLRGVGGQLIGVMGVVGVLFHRGGQLFHAGGGFLDRRRLLLGAGREIGAAGGDFRRGGRNPADPIWIFSIMVRRFWLMAATAFSSCPSSSRRVLVCARRRSPPAMRSAMASVCSGRVICSVMRQR